MGNDLREFLKLARQGGPELFMEATRPLKPKLELNVLQLKLAKEKRYPVIYCPQIEGSKLPLVSNLFGSYELLALALGLDPKTGKSEILRQYRKREGDTKPVQVVPGSGAPVKEVFLTGKDVDLGLLPINHHAEGDSGKFITIGQMVTKNPDTGVMNVGVYRHEVKGKDKIGCMLVPAHHAAYFARRHAGLKRPMEVALFIGHHPSTVFASTSKVPMDVSEYELMGGLLGEGLRVTKAETVDLLVPADAEIVLEGVLDPVNMVSDGPLAEWLGYYGVPRSCYMINLTCMTMRKHAIYHDLAPSQREHNFACVPGNTAAVYNSVKAVVPTVKEVNLPFSGRNSMSAYISIAQRVPGEAKRAALAALNTTDTMRLAVVVDDDIDVFDEEEVMWAVITRTTPDKDVDIITRMLGCPLNPTSYDENRQKQGILNTKMIINATRPVEQPFPRVVTAARDLWQSMKIEDYLR